MPEIDASESAGARRPRQGVEGTERKTRRSNTLKNPIAPVRTVPGFGLRARPNLDQRLPTVRTAVCLPKRKRGGPEAASKKRRAQSKGEGQRGTRVRERLSKKRATMLRAVRLPSTTVPPRAPKRRDNVKNNKNNAVPSMFKRPSAAPWLA